MIRAGPTTIGVSIPIPEPHGAFLQGCRADFGDDAAWRIPAHITVMPPTVVEAEVYEAFIRHCREIASVHEPFTVVLRGTGTFRPVSDVVYIQVAHGVSMCERLERAVRAGPVRRELDFYYHPHVTVAHNVGQADLDRAFEELSDFGASFQVTDLHLYELGEGDGIWRPVNRFRLQGNRL